MTRRIFAALLAASLSVLAATAAMLIWVLYGYFSEMRMESLRKQTRIAARVCEISGMESLEAIYGGGDRLTLISADGSVVWDSSGSSADMGDHSDRPEVRDAMRDGWGEDDRVSGTLSERYMYAASRIGDGSVVRASASHSSVASLMLRMAAPLGVIFTVAAVVSFVLALRLSAKIAAPLNALDLDDPLSNTGVDELAPMLRRLDEATRMRREFTANVSHELKTPLHTISGCAELMRAGMVRPEDAAEFVERIYAESRRMIGLVEDIMRLARLDEGAGEMTFERLDLADAVRSVVSSFTDAAAGAGLELIADLEPAHVSAVRQLVGGIAGNIIDNAIKYTPRGGRVTVTVRGAELSVADTGIGIPIEHQARIFERFYRVDASRSKDAGGTGLGLSIVKHSVEILGAALHLDSTPGAGTRVTVTFPSEMTSVF